MHGIINIKFQVAIFSIFVFRFNDYSEWKKRMTQYCAVHLFLLIYIRLYSTGSARDTCAAAILNRSLLSGRSFYVTSSWFVG